MTPGQMVETKRGVMWVGSEWQDEARQLQRKGMTLTEIAKQLARPRGTIVLVLYGDVVKPKASDA